MSQPNILTSALQASSSRSTQDITCSCRCSFVTVTADLIVKYHHETSLYIIINFVSDFNNYLAHPGQSLNAVSLHTRILANRPLEAPLQ